MFLKERRYEVKSFKNLVTLNIWNPQCFNSSIYNFFNKIFNQKKYNIKKQDI